MLGAIPRGHEYRQLAPMSSTMSGSRSMSSAGVWLSPGCGRPAESTQRSPRALRYLEGALQSPAQLACGHAGSSRREKRENLADGREQNPRAPSKLTPERSPIGWSPCWLAGRRLRARRRRSASIGARSSSGGRAYSRDPRNRRHVELERRLQAARLEAAARTAALAPTDDWRAAALRLEVMAPTRWGLVGLAEDRLDSS